MADCVMFLFLCLHDVKHFEVLLKYELQINLNDLITSSQLIWQIVSDVVFMDPERQTQLMSLPSLSPTQKPEGNL